MESVRYRIKYTEILPRITYRTKVSCARWCCRCGDLCLRFLLPEHPPFPAIDSAFGSAVVAHHPELEGIDSVRWFEPKQEDTSAQVFVRSHAAVRVAAYLGVWWGLDLATRWVPRLLREAVYGFVARHRHCLPGHGRTCYVPLKAFQERFIG